MTNPLQIITLCDVEGCVPKEEYETPIDLVFCLGDMDDIWVKNRVKRIAPRFGAFGVRGNHDIDYPFPDSITDLNFLTEDVTVDGRSIRLAGVPGSWKYKPRGNWLYSQEEMTEKLSVLAAADIVLSHNCPANIGHEKKGESLADDPDGTHQGFAALNDYIAAKKPSYIFHGHQHFEKESSVQGTAVVGCYGEQLHVVRLR